MASKGQRPARSRSTSSGHSNTESYFAALTGSIAVVGNGALLRDFGEFIDTHDVVIRFNAFEIDGYESRCGRKTTHWCTFGDTLGDRLPTKHRRHLKPLSPYTIDAGESGGILPKFRAKMAFASKDYRLPIFRRPSTGIMLLRLLESLGHSADIFGFDGFTSGHYYDSGHQHDPDHLVTEIIYIATRQGLHLYGIEDAPVRPIEEDVDSVLQRLAKSLAW